MWKVTLPMTPLHGNYGGEDYERGEMRNVL